MLVNWVNSTTVTEKRSWLGQRIAAHGEVTNQLFFHCKSRKDCSYMYIQHYFIAQSMKKRSFVLQWNTGSEHPMEYSTETSVCGSPGSGNGNIAESGLTMIQPLLQA